MLKLGCTHFPKSCFSSWKICPQAALIATERNFGRGESEAAAEDCCTASKKETERFISFHEFRLFLLLLSRYFFCCKVEKENITGETPCPPVCLFAANRKWLHLDICNTRTRLELEIICFSFLKHQSVNGLFKLPGMGKLWDQCWPAVELFKVCSIVHVFYISCHVWMFLYLQVHEGNTIALLGRWGKVNSRTSSTAKAVAHINIRFKMREWPLKKEAFVDKNLACTGKCSCRVPAPRRGECWRGPT